MTMLAKLDIHLLTKLVVLAFETSVTSNGEMTGKKHCSDVGPMR